MQALIDTITAYWTSFINFFSNAFTSLKDFLLDLPVLIFEKAMSALLWLFEWASNAVPGSGTLITSLQSGLNELPPAVLYCLNRSDFTGCMQILSIGFLIWSGLKIISFVKAIL